MRFSYSVVPIAAPPWHTQCSTLRRNRLTVSNLRSPVVLGMCQGNPPAVWVWTGKTGRFGSRPVQKPDLQPLGGTNLYPKPSTCGICRIWLDLSVPISGSSFRVFLFMVASRYPTVMCTILALVHHCLYLFYWLPL